MNIYEKLLEVRKAIPYLQKESQGQQYKYTGSSQVLAAVRKKLDDLGLLLITRVVGHQLHSETVEYMDRDKPKKTTTYFTELELEMEWVNVENPTETIKIPFYAQGVDIAGEKGVGKALTYGEKYFMLKEFNIATDKDDPDSFQRRFEDELETDIPPAALKAKYQLGNGSMDGFEEWVKGQQAKGRNFRDMENILQEALTKKKASEPA